MKTGEGALFSYGAVVYMYIYTYTYTPYPPATRRVVLRIFVIIYEYPLAGEPESIRRTSFDA